MRDGVLGRGSLGNFVLGSVGEEEAGIVTLAGASAGTSVATSNLTRTVGLVAATNAVSTATAGLSRTVPLAAATDAVSTATSVLIKVVYLAAATAGASTASANVSPVRGLAAASNSVSTATAILRSENLIAGSTSAASTVTSNLTVSGDKFLLGVSQGKSATHAVLTGGQVTSTVVVVTERPADVSTTVGSTSYGSTTVTVANGAVFSVGQYVTIGGYTYLISNIAGNVLTLSSPLLQDIPSGSLVSGQTVLYADQGGYAVAHGTLLDLEQMSRTEAVLVDMQAREPVYVRAQPLQRDISFDVYFLGTTYAQRRADYDAFVESLESLSGLVTLRWTGVGGQTREYLVAVLTVNADAWFHRGSAILIAPDATPRVAA